ncbi:QueT transporter family protein [Lysinibacillus fusiformis]|uniref:QueT transporter family protein n=1 Tax=Lysinibacillus fusiformis TaxID=28031 RepID=UPI002E1E888C
MNTSTVKDSSLMSASELTKTALVAALYVAVTVLLSVISFGAVQLRLSEMFNYLALYNKRYVVAVTLGVILANFMSPTWIVDVPIGGIATFLVLLLCRSITKHIAHDIEKMVVTALIFAVSMFTVAGQLTILYDLPFWATWFTVGIGELLSMTVGGLTVYLLNKKIDLSK